MNKIIKASNKVKYGCIDELIDYNYQDFELNNFFNKKISLLKKKLVYHQFNYIGFISDDNVIGLAVVDLGYIRNIFCFIYNHQDGLILDYSKNFTGKKNIIFPRNPDEHEINCKLNKTDYIKIKKSHTSKQFSIDCNIKKLQIKMDAKYSLEDKPLRVVNPSDMNRWTFTEKYSPIKPNNINIAFKGNELDFKITNSFVVYDWTGGYLRRETNWLWTSIGGKTIKGNAFGINLASFVNETYFPENAFWVNGTRTRFSNIIYDFNMIDPYDEPWIIHNESDTIHLIFTPTGERSNKENKWPIAKVWFRQLVGEFSGYVIDDDKNKHEIKKAHGFCEIHKSVW